MKVAPRYSSLFQLNTRVWLRRLSSERDKRSPWPKLTTLRSMASLCGASTGFGF